MNNGTTNKQTLSEVVREWHEERKAEEYSEALADLLQNGCQSGMVSELCYHSDTLKFYADHKDEINALLVELCDSTGEQPATLFRDWDKTDPLALETPNQNLLAWFGFEETARMLEESLDEEVV